MDDFISKQAAIETAVSYIEEWNGCQSEYHMQEITKRFQALPSVQPEVIHWISCKDRMPIKCTVYLVTLEGIDYNEVEFCMWNGKQWGWLADSKWSKADDIIAWMPLPEPYTESEAKE